MAFLHDLYSDVFLTNQSTRTESRLRYKVAKGLDTKKCIILYY